MKRRVLVLLCAACVALSGCSLLNREYTIVEEHTSKYWESESADTLRAETYQDIVNDLLLLIGRHKEKAVIRYYSASSESVTEDLMEMAATEVQQETPLGSYAVEYLTSSTEVQRSYDEITVRIRYRRTDAQLDQIVYASNTAALSDLLDATLQSRGRELVVRIGYWDENERKRVDQIVAETRERWRLLNQPAWTVAYYPSEEDAGLIEFIMEDE